jgi:hypothetical protein
MKCFLARIHSLFRQDKGGNKNSAAYYECSRQRKQQTREIFYFLKKNLLSLGIGGHQRWLPLYDAFRNWLMLGETDAISEKLSMIT